MYQIQGVFREVQTRFYYVRAVVKNVKQSAVVLKSEDKYYVKVTNPCLLANQIIAKPISGFLDYWIKDAQVTETVTPFHDWTTDTYGNVVRSNTDFSTGDHLCGQKTY